MDTTINCKEIISDIPVFKTKNGDAGYDLYVTKDIWIFPFRVTKVPVNMCIELPEGTYGLVTSRSGQSLKGVFTIPGIVDETYRGQISAIVTKIGLLPTRIKKGERIAQLVITKYDKPTLQINTELSNTERNHSGFGSSGYF